MDVNELDFSQRKTMCFLRIKAGRASRQRGKETFWEKLACEQGEVEKRDIDKLSGEIG